MQFIICAPANYYSGGPTLSHQLCKKLIEKGLEAKIYYYKYNKDLNPDPVHNFYKDLGLPYTLHLKDEKNTIIITNETFTEIFKNIKNSQKIIWWMSVDFFWDAWKFKIPGIRNKVRHFLLRLKCRNEFQKHFNVKNKDVIHFAQCDYIHDFLIKYGIKKRNIYNLSDFIINLYYSESIVQKENIVLYNPKKGFEFTKLLIKNSPDVTWQPIINLTPTEVRNMLLRGKIYVDFGNHPGKDRLPREAALSNCCIITNYKGSAGNPKDLNIPLNYKIEDLPKNIPDIIKLIRELLSDYDTKINDFTGYKKSILKEEEKFDKDLEIIMNALFNHKC